MIESIAYNAVFAYTVGATVPERTGTDEHPRWNETLDLFLGYLQENGINGTYWAAGPWWDSYFMAITPKDGKDRPQMPIIEKYTSTFKK